MTADLEKMALDISDEFSFWGRAPNSSSSSERARCTSLITQALARVRAEALDAVLKAIDREQAYHEFLEEKGEMRHPILPCKEIRHYVRALKETK